MFKIARVFRISRIISNLNQKQEIKAIYKVVYLILILFLYIHVYACFLYYIVLFEYAWVPPLDFIYGYTTLWERENIYKYFMLLYYAVMSFGRNEIAP